MFYIVASRIAATIALAGACCAVSAASRPPLTLQEPVFGLRIELGKVSLDALPNDVLSKCPDLSNEQESMRLWIYGAAVDAGRRYFVVGGYYVRHDARPSGEPIYSLDTRGVVFYVQGDQCALIGPARETFDARFFEEIPQAVLERLADDLARRLARAFGGADRLRRQFERQDLAPNDLPVELDAAFAPILKGAAK